MRTKEFSNRRGNATSTRLSMIESFKAAQATTAPGLAARSAERVEIARARDARRAARDAEIATRDARQSAQDKRIALVLSDEAARDQRYAKRKAAQQIA